MGDIHRISVDDKTVYQWMIDDQRYSFPRDNNLAPWCCRHNIENYLPKMGEDFRRTTAEQLITEAVGKLRGGHFGEAKGHKATYMREHCQVHYEDGTVKDETLPISTYVLDSAYKEYLADKEGYKPPKYGQDVSKLTVDPEFSWEEEHEWLLLIAFLLDYARPGFKPWNDDMGWLEKARKAAEDEKAHAKFMKEFWGKKTPKKKASKK